MESRLRLRFSISDAQMDELRGRELSLIRYEQHRASMNHEDAVRFMTRFLRHEIRIQIRSDLAAKFKPIYKRDFVMVPESGAGAGVTVEHRRASVLGGAASYVEEFGEDAVPGLVEIGADDEAVRQLIVDIVNDGVRTAVEAATGRRGLWAPDRPRG